MSDFTDRVGSSLMGTMGAVLGAVAAAQAESEARSAQDWKEWAEYYKKAHREAVELGMGIKARFDSVLKSYGRLSALYDKLEEMYIALRAEANDLREQLEKRERELAAKDRELAAKDQELSRTRDLYREADQRAGDMAKLAIEARKRIEELEARLKAQAEEGSSALASSEAQLGSLRGQLERVRRWHAANLALRSALEVQLLRADPDNPLLQDAMLRDRVRRSGEMAFSMAPEDGSVDPYDAAREAGVSFSVPGRPSGVEVLQELALTEAYMKRLDKLAAEQHAERAALAWQLLQGIHRGYGTMTAARELLKALESTSELLQPGYMERLRSLAAQAFEQSRQQRRTPNPRHTDGRDQVFDCGQRIVMQRMNQE